jgi:hypothetical protein
MIIRFPPPPEAEADAGAVEEGVAVVSVAIRMNYEMSDVKK